MLLQEPSEDTAHFNVFVYPYTLSYKKFPPCRNS